MYISLLLFFYYDYYYIMSKVTEPQDAHGMLVPQVYLGSNTLEFSATH